jgi:hypothetical protein
MGRRNFKQFKNAKTRMINEIKEKYMYLNASKEDPNKQLTELKENTNK